MRQTLYIERELDLGLSSELDLGLCPVRLSGLLFLVQGLVTRRMRTEPPLADFHDALPHVVFGEALDEQTPTRMAQRVDQPPDRLVPERMLQAHDVAHVKQRKAADVSARGRIA